MSAGAWQACLDSFEDHLAAQRASLASGSPECVVAFVPPTGLGPLPTELAARARTLAVVVGSLQDELTAAAAATARELQLLTVLHRPEPASASFIDTRG